MADSAVFDRAKSAGSRIGAPVAAQHFGRVARDLPSAFHAENAVISATKLSQCLSHKKAQQASRGAGFVHFIVLLEKYRLFTRRLFSRCTKTAKSRTGAPLQVSELASFARRWRQEFGEGWMGK